MAHDVFITCPLRQSDKRKAVCEQLEAAGLRCWFAPRDLPEGAEWSTSILDAIQSARVVVFLFSQEANESRQIIREIECATARGKVVIPCRLEKVQPRGTLEYLLGNAPWMDLFPPPLAKHVERLIAILRKLPPSTSAPSRPSATPPPVQAPARPPAAPAPPSPAAPAPQGSDVFISYRRREGGQTARLIRAELRQRGFSVFLDVNDLSTGHFDEALLAEIAYAPNFLLILSPNSLAHCRDDEDWVRKEIAQAIRVKSNIIPLMMPDFAFPQGGDLPEDIRPLRLHHGVTYSHEFFDAMMDKIVKYLRPQGSRQG